MSTSKTLPTNGTSKPTPKVETTVSAIGTQPNNEGKAENKLPVITPVKDETKQIEQNHADEQKPIEDRVYRVQMLSDLVDRREKLIETLRKLNSFKLSSDGSRDKLTINDGKSNEFLTTNSAVIKDVIETLKTSTQQKLEDLEKQITL